jgi:RNA polymerase sigma factor (sigma-70 family)
MNTLSANAIAFYCGHDKRIVWKLDKQRGLLVIIWVMKGFLDSDARLLQALLAGDNAAWQKFILIYSNFIYRAIIKYTDDYDEKMAVYLHILEKLNENGFERLRAFAFKSKLSTWLTVVSRRLALDFLRSKYGRDFRLKKIRVVSIDAEPDYLKLLADPVTPEKVLAVSEQQELRERLEADLRLSMAALSDQERLAVQLVYFQGLRIREVGKLLKLPAAYKFMGRALQKIKAKMETRTKLSRGQVRDALEGEAHE